MPDNLPELRDIHLPEGVSAFPLAYGWWVILLTVIVVFVLWKFYKIIRQKSKKLYALRLLASINEPNVITSAAAMSELLRRICVYKYPQAVVLQGQEWINFLNSHSKKTQVSGKIAELLLNAPYMPLETAAYDNANLNTLRSFCRDWIGENL